MKIIESSNYKKAQLSNHPHGDVFPSDRDEAYFLGEDEYANIEHEKEQQENRDYIGIQDATKRYERLSKVRSNQDAIKRLEEELHNPNTDEARKGSIRLQIGKHVGAISNILNTPGKSSTPPLPEGMTDYKHSPASDYKLEDIKNPWE